MDKVVYWRPLQYLGLEQLHLVEDALGILADGLVVGDAEATPFRLAYQLRMDRAWRIQDCMLRLVQTDGEPEQILRLSTDGQGHWTDDAGVVCSSLNGCLDLDISCTPFTNTLPIRRLALSPGESADLSFRPLRQRYTCLARTASGWRYRYDALDGQAAYDLLVDEHGLVMDYPGIWQRTETASPDPALSSRPGVVLD